MNTKKVWNRIEKSVKPTLEFEYVWDEGSANEGLKFVTPHKNKAKAYNYFIDKVQQVSGLSEKELSLKRNLKNRDFKGIKSISVNVNPHYVEDMDYVYPREFDVMKDVNIVRGKYNNPETGVGRKPRKHGRR